MEEDLNMSRTDYNMTLSVFFIGYAVFEPFANALLKLMTPRVFFTLIILFWGVMMTLMGVVTNFGGLLAARFFLGLAEAGLFPGYSPP
jgi:MFS family permease